VKARFLFASAVMKRCPGCGRWVRLDPARRVVSHQDPVCEKFLAMINAGEPPTKITKEIFDTPEDDDEPKPS
jgi:hypothetical protein